MSFIINLIFSSIFLLHNAHANNDLMKNLSVDDQKQVKEGKLVVTLKEFDDRPWPKIKIISLIEATPIESIAIYAAYDYQKEYVPKIIKSNVVKEINPNEVLVEYEMEAPWPLSNIKYIHGHKIKKFNKNSYQLHWYMIKSTSTDRVDGNAQFIPYGNKTLFIYNQSIDPKSIFAGIVRKIMVNDTKKSIQTIIDHTEKLVREKGPLLEKYVQKIKGALNKKYVYSTVLKKPTY